MKIEVHLNPHDLDVAATNFPMLLEYLTDWVSEAPNGTITARREGVLTAFRRLAHDVQAAAYDMDTPVVLPRRVWKDVIETLHNTSNNLAQLVAAQLKNSPPDPGERP